MMYHLLAFMSDKYYLLLHMKYRDINGKFVMLLLDEVSSVLNVDEVSYCYRKNARFFYA